MKKLAFRLAALLVLCLPFTAFAAGKDNEVVVYNWSEYIPQDVLDAFTKETGIKVVYSTFESNEAMFAKVKLQRGKGYDVVVPSGYFVDLMRQEKLLAEIDHSKLPNLRHVDASLLHQEFDPEGKVSVPYMWGSTGIAYNTKFIKEGDITRWTDLLNPAYKGKLILTDDLRDAFGIALKATGASVNSKDPKEVEAAYTFLTKLKPSVRVFDVTAIKQALISEEVWAGPIWNGDYLVAQEENEHLRFVYPAEGSPLWVDSFVIPAGAANKENAHIFINYMLRPETAKRCVEEYKYSTPNKDALALLPQEQRENPILVPTEKELAKSEFLTGIGSAMNVYEKYWEKVKTLK